MPPVAPPLCQLIAPPPPGGLAPPAQLVHAVFDPAVPMAGVADTLDLALLAAESLYGADRLRLDASWAIDPGARSVTVDTSLRVGRTLALIFLGYARREFGPDAARVHRVNAVIAPGRTGGGR